MLKTLSHRIKILPDDKGGEYMSKDFGEFLVNGGIARQHTVCGEPHQNGVAERANCTLEESATACNRVSSSSLILGPCYYHPGPCTEQVTHKLHLVGISLILASMGRNPMCLILGCLVALLMST